MKIYVFTLVAAATGQLMPTNSAASEIRLDDLKPLSAKVGFGPYMVNKFPAFEVKQGAKLLVDGDNCDHYLFAHANSEVSFAVPVGFSKFSAVGIAPSIRLSPIWTYQVLADGKSIFKSERLLTYPGRQVRIDVDLPEGTQTLTLVTEVTDGTAAHSIWANPRFLSSSIIANTAQPAPKSPDPYMMRNSQPQSATTGAGALEKMLEGSRWDVNTESGQRAWGDIRFNGGHEFMTMNGPQGSWKATSERKVELGSTYLVEFAQNMWSLVVTDKDGKKVATGRRWRPSIAAQSAPGVAPSTGSMPAVTGERSKAIPNRPAVGNGSVIVSDVVVTMPKLPQTVSVPATRPAPPAPPARIPDPPATEKFSSISDVINEIPRGLNLRTADAKWNPATSAQATTAMTLKAHGRKIQISGAIAKVEPHPWNGWSMLLRLNPLKVSISNHTIPCVVTAFFRADAIAALGNLKPGHRVTINGDLHISKIETRGSYGEFVCELIESHVQP